MRSLALLALASMALSAHADTYVCMPVNPSEPVHRVALTTGYYPHNEFKIFWEDGRITTSDAEYGDDMDSVYYYSETEDALLSWEWSPMHASGTADGELILNFESETKSRQIIQLTCTDNYQP